VDQKPHHCSNNNFNLPPHKVAPATSHSSCCDSSCCDSSCQTRRREEQQAPGGPGERKGGEEQGGVGERRGGEEQAPGGPGERRRGEEGGGAVDYLELHSSCFSPCRPEEEEEEEEEEEDCYSDWSEEDLSLHFSPSIILLSDDEESDRETGETQNKEEGPRGKGGFEVAANQLPAQSTCHRPEMFLRQHSMPAYYQRRLAPSEEEGPRGYRGLLTAARSEFLGPGSNSKPRLQKSLSLDETKTKMASCLIK
ncbi:hypothetical protein CRUP_023134, partial [Coryphaenoides rupestris]